MKNITRYSGTIEIHEFTNMPCATHRIDPKGNWCKVIDVDELINKLKCCGNCKHSLTRSQMGLEDTRPCRECIDESLWEMED